MAESIGVLGAIGGHLGRRRDGPPGTQVLWFGDDASRLKGLILFVGEIPLQRIHDGSLTAYVEDCRAKGLKKKTINNGQEIVRRILNLSARKWRERKTAWSY
jgi:hypothetical protein